MNPSTEELEGAKKRVAERFATQRPPEVLDHIPKQTVRDAALNLARALDGDSTVLSRADRLLIGYAVAVAKVGCSNGGFSAWIAEAAGASGKTADDIEAAAAVALTCATYNGYYKFRSVVADPKPFEAFSPALRATPFLRSSLGKTMVELISVAVSVVNGCSSCVNGHIDAVMGAGLANPHATIDEVVRINAVVSALAVWDVTHQAVR